MKVGMEVLASGYLGPEKTEKGEKEIEKRGVWEILEVPLVQCIWPSASNSDPGSCRLPGSSSGKGVRATQETQEPHTWGNRA